MFIVRQETERQQVRVTQERFPYPATANRRVQPASAAEQPLLALLNTNIRLSSYKLLKAPYRPVVLQVEDNYRPQAAVNSPTMTSKVVLTALGTR